MRVVKNLYFYPRESRNALQLGDHQGRRPGDRKVKAPDGTVGTIPRSQLDNALKEGYTLVGE